MSNYKNLGEAEFEIMQVIWDASAALTSNAVLESLHGKRRWALSTLMTSLARLAEKGYLICDRSTGQNLYSAKVLESDYKFNESKNFLTRMYHSSVTGLVASLHDGKLLDENDIAELRNYLDTLEKR